MATLLSTYEVREIAFRWSGTTRVFRNNELTVDGDEDLVTWPVADKTIGYNFSGVRLQFLVFSPFLQRVSPSADTGNDWIDVKNAILNPAIEVEFYPMYSLDATVKYVIAPVASRNTTVLKVKRGMSYPEARLEFVTNDQLSEYPAWLRNTRTRG